MRKIPSRARLTAYPAAEHLGLIWVCLSGEPVYPLPENPYFGDESFRHIEVEPYNWNCALPRRIENYVDFGHFAWVHDGVLGGEALTIPSANPKNFHQAISEFWTDVMAPTTTQDPGPAPSVEPEPLV